MAGNDSSTSSNQVPCSLMDIVKCIAAPVAEYLKEPAIREVECLFCPNKVINGLENAKKELTLNIENMQSRFEQAKQRTEVTGESIEERLENAKNLLKEMPDLQQFKKEAASKGWWTRYCLCRQMAEKTKSVTDFISRSSTKPIFHIAPLPVIQYYSSSENFTLFESTKLPYRKLLEALQNESIYKIGLYGMGGSGKTSLAAEVGKEAEKLNLFDRVILLTVSQTPNIINIQRKMADMLNLELKEEFEDERAQRLWVRLEKENRLLIIVDDLWGEFNLKKIGVPLENNDKGSWKILLTTRSKEICNSMNCREIIQLGLLSEDEAWTLFQKHAEIDDAFSKSSNDVPRQLCKECKGLPIAIVAVGSSLKRKSNAEWKVALYNLRHSEKIDDSEEKGLRVAFSCLQLSYDFLKDKEAKLLFLMCSMFPEDYEIFIEDLIRYAIGLRRGSESPFDIARSQIMVGINKLVDSCLLMHSGKSKHHVKMHDMVREVALRIASRSEDHKILVNLDKSLSSLVKDDAIKDYFAVSSRYMKEDEISLQLHAPNLKILLLNTDFGNSSDLSHASLEGIKGLKVMAVNVIPGGFTLDTSLSLPPSTQLLTSLQTLRLNEWHLEDMSFLASLTSLEILDLQGCSFNEFPNKIDKLERLKLLDLSYCWFRENNNYEAIGRCSKLEELYAFGYGDAVFRSQSFVDIIITLPKLQRFVIQNGWPQKYEYAESMRFLELEDFNISKLGACERNLFQIVENVRLYFLRGDCQSIVPDMVGVVGSMNYLTNLSLSSCLQIECLIDTTSDQFSSHQEDDLIPRLVKLDLLGMGNLKEVCRGSSLQVLGFFKKLEELEIKSCSKLRSIFPGECNLHNLKILTIINCKPVEVLFSMSVAQSLQQLEVLTIEKCERLKNIITYEGEDGSNTSKEILPSMNSHSVMTNLKKLSIGNCDMLEFIFPISCVEGLAQLQEIAIEKSSKLKYVFGHYGHEDHSSYQNKIEIKLPLLKVFKLIDLENILWICQKPYHLRYPSLGDASIVSCPNLSQV